MLRRSIRFSHRDCIASQGGASRARTRTTCSGCWGGGGRARLCGGSWPLGGGPSSGHTEQVEGSDRGESPRVQDFQATADTTNVKPIAAQNHGLHAAPEHLGEARNNAALPQVHDAVAPAGHEVVGLVLTVHEETAGVHLGSRGPGLAENTGQRQSTKSGNTLTLPIVQPLYVSEAVSVLDGRRNDHRRMW